MSVRRSSAPTAPGLKTMSEALFRIAEALERLAPAPMPSPDFSAEAFAWHTGPDRLEPVKKVARVDIGLLIGVNLSLIHI